MLTLNLDAKVKVALRLTTRLLSGRALTARLIHAYTNEVYMADVTRQYGVAALQRTFPQKFFGSKCRCKNQKIELITRGSVRI